MRTFSLDDSDFEVLLLALGMAMATARGQSDDLLKRRILAVANLLMNDETDAEAVAKGRR